MSVSAWVVPCLVLMWMPSRAGDPPVLVLDVHGRTLAVTAESVSNDNEVYLPVGGTYRLIRVAPADKEINGRLIIHGTPGDDLLIVDFKRGNPIPTGGLIYHGKQQTTQTGDAIHLEGGAVGGTSYQPTQGNDGILTIGGRVIEFTGLEPVIDAITATNLIVNGTGAANAITFDARPMNPHPTFGNLNIVYIDAFEHIEFNNKTNLFLNGQPGDDAFFISEFINPGSLSSILVDGQQGIDSLTLDARGGCALDDGSTLSGDLLPVDVGYASIESVQIVNGETDAPMFTVCVSDQNLFLARLSQLRGV